MLREATQIQSRVASSAKMWTGEEEPSPALLQLLLKDGFEATREKPGKWTKGDAVRVPWRLVSDDVEGILTMSMTKTDHGAVGVRLELDSLAFPSMFKPIVYESVGNFTIPIPTMGFKYGGLAVGFFAYVDLSEKGSRTFVVRMGAKFEFQVGISLLPDALTKPFPQPLPIIFSHDFSEPIASVTNVVEAGIVAAASGAGAKGTAPAPTLAVASGAGAVPLSPAPPLAVGTTYSSFGLQEVYTGAVSGASHAANFGSGVLSGATAILTSTVAASFMGFTSTGAASSIVEKPAVGRSGSEV